MTDAADVLLTEMANFLGPEDVVRAFADDTGVVVSDYEATLPILQVKFAEYAEISGLDLNILKRCSCLGGQVQLGVIFVALYMKSVHVGRILSSRSLQSTSAS